MKADSLFKYSAMDKKFSGREAKNYLPFEGGFGGSVSRITGHNFYAPGNKLMMGQKLSSIPRNYPTQYNPLAMQNRMGSNVSITRPKRCLNRF